MKGFSILCFLFFIAEALLAQSQKYSIKGKLKGLGNQTVYLTNKAGGYSSATKLKIIDSCYSENDTFLFKGNIAEPDFRSIEVPSLAIGWQTFILENTEYTITGQIDSLHSAKIEGGPQQSAYLNYNNRIHKPFDKKYFYYKQKIDENNNVSLYKDSMDNLLVQFNWDFLNFIKTNSDMLIGFNRLYSYAGMKMLTDSTQIAAFESLSPKLKRRGIEKGLDVRIRGGLKVGDYLPNFTMEDVSGRKVTLSASYRKYVLVDFWASWCVPCRVENEHVQKAYVAYKGKGFEVLGISTDFVLNSWKKAVADDGMTWTNIVDPDGKVSGEYHIKSIPSNYLLDPTGKIIGINLRGEGLYETLKNTL